jgi:hypothetical protein
MLLFLNMADQLTEPPHSKPPIVPPNLGWKPLLKLDGAALEKQYSDSIEKLGLKPGMLGVIFKGARCDIHNPALFKQLIVNLLRFVLRNFESPWAPSKPRGNPAADQWIRRRPRSRSPLLPQNWSDSRPASAAGSCWWDYTPYRPPEPERIIDWRDLRRERIRQRNRAAPGLQTSVTARYRFFSRP